jgi:hypothetical protein
MMLARLLSAAGPSAAAPRAKMDLVATRTAAACNVTAMLTPSVVSKVKATKYQAHWEVACLALEDAMNAMIRPGVSDGRAGGTNLKRDPEGRTKCPILHTK